MRYGKKNVKVLCFLSVLFAIMLLSVGCRGKDKNAETGDTVETGMIYTADTEIFETFEDLKANVGIFADKLPCTRSTKGYHSPEDGGAGTYEISTTKPDGVSERLTEGVYARLLTDGNVVPQQMGAYGNGSVDDTVAILRAVAYANENGLKLELPEGIYRTVTPLELKDIDVISDNATVAYYGTHLNRPAIEVKDKVNIYGTINVSSEDNHKSNHGGRCGVGFGVYDTGEGAHNVYIEHVVIISGGYPTANAILITGDSSDITIDKVTIPEENDTGIGVLIHWGNYNDHHPVKESNVELGYDHVENWSVTRHPHDIKIGVIDSYAHHSALYVSAAYNIEVGEVISRNSKFAMTVSGGDIGFEFANATEKAHGQKNIYVKKLSGTGITNCGAYLNTSTVYTGCKTTQAEVKIDEIYLEAAANNTSVGIACYSAKLIDLGTVTVKKYPKQALQIGYDNESLNIDKFNVDSCYKYAINADAVIHSSSRNVNIGEINVIKGGNSGFGFANLEAIDGLHIGKINVTASMYNYMLVLTDNAKNVTIDDMVYTSPLTKLTAVVMAKDTITEDNNIAVGKYSCGDVPFAAGSDCVIAVG